MAHALKDLFCVVSIVAVFAGAYVFWNNTNPTEWESPKSRTGRSGAVERDMFVFGPSPFTYEPETEPVVERKPTSSYRPPSTAVPSKGGFQRSWPQYFEGQRVPSALQRAPRGSEIELMMLCGYEGYPWSLERCERWAKRKQRGR